MNYKGPDLSTYWGDEEFADRRAMVLKNDQGFYVELYKSDELIETRPLYDHSERYAEDCAENFVMGYFL